MDYSSLLSEIILKKRLLTEEQLRGALSFSQESNTALEEALVEKNLMKNDQVGHLISEAKGWQFVDLHTEPVDKSILKLIPESVSVENKVLAFRGTDKNIQVAMHNPGDTALIKHLGEITGRKIIPYFSAYRDIRSSLIDYHDGFINEFGKLVNAYTQESNSEITKNSSIVRIVDTLLLHGYESKASDIHIEPEETRTIVRFRMDGVMHDIINIPQELHDLVVTRIKILAKLRTDEHQMPQDGKLQYQFEGEMVDIRISVVPTIRGENVVMRLLSEKSRQLSLQDLGFSEKDLRIITKHIKNPWGMILATGPTGSGKTTTLYAILKILNKREVNILTIEDPVEYNIEGVTQIQVNPRTQLTFATGLRSIVRQDPNIIMVGEIRDDETADIAINSAMTGHLVLSTMHTNDAATTLPRFLNMGIKPFLVISTINVVIAQRLMRKICQNCKEKYEVSMAELHDKIPKPVLNRLLAGKDTATLFKAPGCNDCQHTGYKGRIGIYEVLEMNDDIRSMVLNAADANTIQKKAIEGGMTTLFDDALEKILNGMSTIEEMIRVVKK